MALSHLQVQLRFLQALLLRPVSPSFSCMQGPQFSPVFQPSAERCSLPQLLQVINAFLSEVWPAGTWNAVCVGRNTTARAHRDLANTPGSVNLTLSVGEFAGGQLWVEDVNGDTPVCLPNGVLLDGRLHNTHNSPLLFPCIRPSPFKVRDGSLRRTTCQASPVMFSQT